MISRVPGIHPASSKRYILFWPASELGDGVTITSSQWGRLLNGAFDPNLTPGLQKDAEDLQGNQTSIQISVTTAALGDVIDIVNQIQTSDGETLHETLPIMISNVFH